LLAVLVAAGLAARTSRTFDMTGVARSRRGIAGLLAVGLPVAVAAVTGCTQAKPTVAPIRVGNAFVMQANGVQTLSGYLVISNAGSADRLLSVRSSAGGKIVMLGPSTSGGAVARALTQMVIPAHRLTRLDPTGNHLEIIGSPPLHEGNDVTLTLVFAHAGPMAVQAEVSNPQTDSGGYFGP
jgi:copper(I)-binding protein